MLDLGGRVGGQGMLWGLRHTAAHSRLRLFNTSLLSTSHVLWPSELTLFLSATGAG